MSTLTSGQPGGGDRQAAAVQELDHAAVRFAGDSGDGMQLAGTQLTSTSAVFGNDVSTLPDYPAEIRAPSGTLAGVSGFQINFSSHRIHTPGDRVDALIAMNPAALKANLGDLAAGGILVVNSDEFTPLSLRKAGYHANPLETGELRGYRLYQVPITRQTVAAVAAAGLGARQAARCKNFYALGLVYWLYERPLETTRAWIDRKFAKVPALAQANKLALQAGYHFGETAELFPVRYRVQRARLAPGRYRNLTGNQATALGMIAAARLAGKPLVYGAYPITPASDILHELALHRNFDVRTFQAEDEIAAFGAVLGAAFAGAVGVTASSGPGIALKAEGVGLAVMTELPCVIIDVQRGGPSTGLPTKPEQADLWQVMFARHGEAPLPVVAARSPADCFWTVIEAVRIAIKYMTPVFMLSDGYLANGSEPWRIPPAAELPRIAVSHPGGRGSFQPYRRDEFGARPWAIPGTPGLEHRVGGLEKADLTGEVSYDPQNHQRMVRLRAQKVANVARDIGRQEVFGDPAGELLVVSWGGTFGAVRTGVAEARRMGQRVSHLHLRWLNPLPADTGAILKRFRRLLVCEMNMGQLELLLRGRFLVETAGFHKVQGRPFTTAEIRDKALELLGGA